MFLTVASLFQLHYKLSRLSFPQEKIYRNIGFWYFELFLGQKITDTYFNYLECLYNNTHSVFFPKFLGMVLVRAELGKSVPVFGQTGNFNTINNTIMLILLKTLHVY